MSFLSKATGWVSKGLAYTPFTGFGALNSATGHGAQGPLSGLVNKGGKAVGVTTPGQSVENKKLSAEAEAIRLAAERKAHDDSVAALGAGSAEALRNKRRRGLYATILTGSGPTFGTPAASSGAKTLGG